MERRQFVVAALTLLATPAVMMQPVFAATFAEQIVEQLRGQGFQDIVVTETWLGRVRIEAVRADISREIVLNPNTGEILRDLSSTVSGDAAPTITIRSDDGGKSSTVQSGADGSGHDGGGSEDKSDKDEHHSGGGDD